MEHVVFFTAPDGTPAYRRATDLEDAVRLVEHLRNVKGVPEASVHPLGDAVPLAFRTWYRVEVPGVEPRESEPVAQAADVPPVEAADVAPVEPEPVAAEPVPAPVALAEAPLVEPVVEPAPEIAASPAVEPVEPAEPVVEVPAQVPPLQPVGSEQDPAGNGHRESVPTLGFFAT